MDLHAAMREFVEGVSFGVGCETVAVVVCFLFLGGRGASQLPGCEGGMM